MRQIVEVNFDRLRQELENLQAPQDEGLRTRQEASAADVAGRISVRRPTSWGLHAVGIFYVPFGLALFIFTQPDV